MDNLRFDFEWQDPGGAKGEELRATWASLSILIGDAPVTELRDRHTKSVRTRIFLPLYPLAEWIADNWWFLLSEFERPTARPYDFERRHNIRRAREGFVLPSVRFVTLGKHVEARWQSLDIPQAGIGFLATGQAVMAHDCFETTLRAFVDSVVARLDQMDIQETALHEQWQVIQSADPEERDFCRAAAQLGRDPYAVDDELEAAILDAHQKVRPELLDDLLSLATVERLAGQTSAIVSATKAIELDDDNIDALEGVRRHAPPRQPGLNSWETGYKFAEDLRANINGEAWKSRSLQDLAGRLGIDQLDHCLAPATDECRFRDALVGSNQQRKPKILMIKKQREDSKQFKFCRALFEHLTSPSDNFSAVTKVQTDRQQMNRAFAAEFLAPHEMLRNDLSGPIIGEDELDDLAIDYGVSAFVVRHQIENHRLASISS